MRGGGGARERDLEYIKELNIAYNGLGASLKGSLGLCNMRKNRTKNHA